MSEANIIARPYAKAVFEVAIEQQALDAWSTNILALAAVIADKDIANLLHHPQVSDQQVVEIILEATGSQLDTLQQNFLKLLAANKRLSYLPAIAQLFEEYKAEYAKTLNVDVSSAIELSQNQREKLIHSLQQRFKRDIALQCEIDTSLIGGALIRAGDIVIDGTVQGKLARLIQHVTMKESLCQQS